MVNNQKCAQLIQYSLYKCVYPGVTYKSEKTGTTGQWSNKLHYTHINKILSFQLFFKS